MKRFPKRWGPGTMQQAFVEHLEENIAYLRHYTDFPGPDDRYWNHISALVDELDYDDRKHIIFTEGVMHGLLMVAAKMGLEIPKAVRDRVRKYIYFGSEY